MGGGTGSGSMSGGTSGGMITMVQDEARIREIEDKLAKEKEEIRRRADEEREKIEN